MAQYRQSTLAKHACRLNARAGCSGIRLPALILITDRRRAPCPFIGAARLPLGSAVILRDYDAANRSHLARAMAKLCRAARLKFLIAGDAALAAKLRADGVHFGEARIRDAAKWRRRRPGWLITVAAHSRTAIRAAVRARADAILLSPVFATASHPGARPLGPIRFAALCRPGGIPAYALGGIGHVTVARLRHTGACGIAAIDALA